MQQDKDTDLIKVRFSIGAKLITIITFIVLISLGSIIVLVSWLVRGDLQVIAEATNYETNDRSAKAAETTFENIVSNSMILLRTITAVGTESALAKETSDFFFERNSQIACVFFNAAGRPEILFNERFLETGNINPDLADAFRSANEPAMRRAAAGETVLLNAAPHFSSSVLALFFPFDNKGVGVLFEPAALNDSFGSGVNKSLLINDSGDILIHSNFELVRNGTNIADNDFIKAIWINPSHNEQTLYADDDGVRYFGAFTKIKTAGAVVITSVEYDKVFEGIDATTLRNFYLTITVLSIAIIIIWFFAKSISVPIRALADAAHEIESGNFEISLKPKGRDEIGVLTHSFRRMCKALGIFGRFTNREIATKAMRGEIKPGGLPKTATIFFSDIRDFTSISENFTNIFGDEASDRIVFWLNNYLTKMIECVEKTKGDVDKFIGDAVMAHWGTVYTTGSTRRDAYKCVVSAIMMRKALQKINKLRNKEDPGSPHIRIGIGINTGLVTAGQIGSDVRMEYTVIGDPVNLASRVESLCKTFGTDILITENTWRLVRKRFLTEEMPPIYVKGKEKPIRVFAVINYAKNPKGPKTLKSLRKLLGFQDPGNLKKTKKEAGGVKKVKYKFINRPLDENFGKMTGKYYRLTDDEIQNLAYKFFEKRNHQHGYDENDWYNAVNRLYAKYESRGYTVIYSRGQG